MDRIEEFANEIISLAKEKGLKTYELCQAADKAREMACKSVAKESSLEDLFLLYSILFLSDYAVNSGNNFDFLPVQPCCCADNL